MNQFNHSGAMSGYDEWNLPNSDFHSGLTPPPMSSTLAQTSVHQNVNNPYQTHMDYTPSQSSLDGNEAMTSHQSGPTIQAAFPFDSSNRAAYQYFGPPAPASWSGADGVAFHDQSRNSLPTSTSATGSNDALDEYFNTHLTTGCEQSALIQEGTASFRTSGFDPSLPHSNPPFEQLADFPATFLSNAEQQDGGGHTNSGEAPPELSDNGAILRLLQLIEAGPNDGYVETGSPAIPLPTFFQPSAMPQPDGDVADRRPTRHRAKAKQSVRSDTTLQSAQSAHPGKARNHRKVNHDAPLKPEHALLTGAELLDGRIEPGDICGELLLHIGKTQRNIDISNALNEILHSQGKKETGRNLIAQRIQDALKAKYGVGAAYEAGRRQYNTERAQNNVKVFEEEGKGYNLAYQAELYKKGQETKQYNRDQSRKVKKRTATTANLDESAELDTGTATAQGERVTRSVRRLKSRKLDPNRASNFPVEG